MRRPRTVSPPNTNTNTPDAQTDGVYTRSVGQVMSRPVETVAPNTSLRAAAATMIERDLGAVVLVDDDDRPVGILTGTDLVALVADGGVDDDATVADVGRTEVVTTTRDTTAPAAAATMIDHLIHHLPVVDDEGAVVGLVSSLDFAAELARTR